MKGARKLCGKCYRTECRIAMGTPFEIEECPKFRTPAQRQAELAEVKKQIAIDTAPGGRFCRA